MDLIVSYRIASELIMFVLCIILLLLMVITKPRNTVMFRMTQAGIALTMLAIILRISLLSQTFYSVNEFWEHQYIINYVALCICTILLLGDIFMYINFLSYRRRSQKLKVHISMFSFSIIYAFVLFYPLCRGMLYTIQDGYVSINNTTRFFVACGMICCISCFTTALANRKTVARIVSISMFFFIPLDFLALVLQYHYEKIIFLSITSVMPMVIFYIMFHSNSFDDIVGCQNGESSRQIIERAIQKNQKYVLMYIRFPQAKKLEFSGSRRSMDEIVANRFRKVERIRKGIRIYMPNTYTLFLFCKINKESEIDFLQENVENVLSTPVELDGMTYTVYFKQIVMGPNPYIKNSEMALSFVGYMNRKFNSNLESEKLIPSNKDYVEFEKCFELERNLLDMKLKQDLSDERVKCYFQPIYSKEAETFQHAESLMRMEIDGVMYYPDFFIPVAESNECIHTLTLIMLNKVCLKVKELEEQEFDFEGISLNCSTLELADEKFAEEVLSIINRHHINAGHIRMEITESTFISKYDTIVANMQTLKEKGIQFYLDDFGTGYSNYERIITFPFETIKFDKSIMYHAMKDEKADKLIRTMADYFKECGLRTLVEGVETKEHYEYCNDVGFEYYQGYMYAKPMPIEYINDYFPKMNKKL